MGTPWLTVGPSRGGTEKALFELSRALAIKHDVHVVCPAPLSPTFHATDDGVEFHYAPVKEVARYPVRDRLDFSLDGLLLALRFFFSTLAVAVSYLQVHRKLGFHATYFSNKYVAAPVLWGLRRGRDGILVYSERNIWPWLHPVPEGGWSRIRYWANVFLGKSVCRRSTLVHVNSESLRDAMAGMGVNERTMVPIPNGADLPADDGFTPLSKPVRVGFIGRLAEDKGIGILLRAIRILNATMPDVEFEIFGDGPMRPVLLGAGLRNCALRGERPREEVLAALRSIHITLFVSPVENIPSVALLEAMACGKAVVATGVGDTPRFLSDGRNALLCRPSAEDVAKAVVTLSADRGLYDTIAHGGRDLAASYTWNKIARRHMELLEGFDSLGKV